MYVYIYIYIYNMQHHIRNRELTKNDKDKLHILLLSKINEK